MTLVSVDTIAERRAALRTVPGGMTHAYHTMNFDAFLDAVGCPVCQCTKSGFADEPTYKSEACGDLDCICHDDFVTLNWLSMMGGPQVDIEAEVDDLLRTVTVDASTLEVMAASIESDGPLDDEGNAATATAIRETPALPDGRYDVTELGGGYSLWMDGLMGDK